MFPPARRSFLLQLHSRCSSLPTQGLQSLVLCKQWRYPAQILQPAYRSSQEYGGHFVCTVDTSEKGLPPPPGLDRFAARSLQRLEIYVQRLEIQPLIHRVAEHVIWLRLWLQIGTITVALVLTGQWTEFIHSVRKRLTRPWYMNRHFNWTSPSRDGRLAVLRSPRF